MPATNGLQTKDPLPSSVVENIKTMLRSTSYYDLGEISKRYFEHFRTLIYHERFGYSSWFEAFSHPELVPYMEIFNSGLSVRLRRTQKPEPAFPAPAGSSTASTSAEGASRSTLAPRKELESSRIPPKQPKLRAEPTSSAHASGSGRTERLEDDTSISESADSWTTDCAHESITPENKARLARELGRVNFIPRDTKPQGIITFSALILERVLGPERTAMFIDCAYCNRTVLQNLMEVKAEVKHPSSEGFTDLRRKCNEFEFDRGSIFQNGAAIKLANIDALFGNFLTNPKGPDGNSLLLANELLYFADIYGGPGGCAEYILWKKKWESKGFGISPRGRLDYNLFPAEHYPRESFEAYYGEDGVKGTGDILKPYNLARFASFVSDNTDGNGVHFVVGSAGYPRDHDRLDEDQKEIRCKYLFLAQFLLALKIVRQGGHYVCRFYDMYTHFTAGLIYLMFRTFEQVAVIKPDTCLPASSERYVVCKWRKADFHLWEIINYLSECHKMDWLTTRNKGPIEDERADIIHLVSQARMSESSGFCRYLIQTNNEYGKRQFAESRSLLNRVYNGKGDYYVEHRLKEIMDKCNNQWGIPRGTRQKPKYSRATTAELRAKKLVIPYSFEFFETCEMSGEVELTLETMCEDMQRIKEWIFVSAGRNRGFFLCLGGTNVYQFGGAKWNAVKDNIELMNNTLVYADLVDEIKMNGSNQIIKTSFHIIDALVLGGTDIRLLPSNERYDLICKYAKSMNKQSREDLATIRAKQQYDLKHFSKYMARVTECDSIRSNDGEGRIKFTAPVQLHQDNGLIYCPTGILFIKCTKENFAPADTRFCMSNRMCWHWSVGVDMKVPEEVKPDVTNSPSDGYEEMVVDTKQLASTANILRHILTH